jgi:hypothetical protein
VSFGTPVILVDIVESGGASTSPIPSFTTIAGELTTLTLHAHPTGGNAQPTITDGNRTWFLIAHNAYDNASSGNGLTVFGTVSGATGGATADFGASQTQTKVGQAVIRHPGAGGWGRTAVGSGNSTAALATLTGFALPTNGVFAAHGCSGNRTFTPGAGFSEITDRTDASIMALQTEWQAANDTTADATISSTALAWGSVAIELYAIGSRTLGPNIGGVAEASGGGATAVTSVDITIPATRNGSTLVYWGGWSSTAGTRTVASSGATWSVVYEGSGSYRYMVWVSYDAPAGTTTVTIGDGATACDMSGQVYELVGALKNGRKVVGVEYGSVATELVLRTKPLAVPYPSIALALTSQLTTSFLPPVLMAGGKWRNINGLGTVNGQPLTKGHSELAGGGGYEFDYSVELEPTTVGPTSVTYPSLIGGNCLLVAFEIAPVPNRRKVPAYLTANPRRPAKLNFVNPITSGLQVLAYPVGDKFFEATAGVLVGASSGTLVPRRGSGLYFDGATSALLKSNAATTAAFTILALCSLEANEITAVNYHAAVSIAQDAALYVPGSLGDISTDNLLNGAVGWTLGQPSPFTPGVPLAVVLTNSGSPGTVFAYKNGASLGASLSFGTFTPANNNVYAGVGQAGLEFYTGTLYAVLVWNRVLADAEIQSVSANPWQLLIDSGAADLGRKRALAFDGLPSLALRKVEGWF